MTNERMIEIMELVIDLLISDGNGIDGLCLASYRLSMYGEITNDEYTQFTNYVKSNAPNIGLAYRWTPYKHTERKEWLQQQIEILKTTTHEQI